MWLRTPAGKWMPVDEGLHEYQLAEDGTSTLINDRGEVIRCNLAFSGKPDGLARVPHWSTCPHADSHRKKALDLTEQKQKEEVKDADAPVAV